MTIINYLTLIFLLILIACNSEHSTGSLTNQNSKADLIIDMVTYTRLSSRIEVDPPEPVIGGPRFEFTLKIKNIGTAEVSSPFMIANSQSTEDFDSLYCSHGQLVNYPPVQVPVNGSLETKIVCFIEDSVQNVLIVINTNNQYNRGVTLPEINELDYTNNSYVQPLSW
jgi:hypothetical protein